MPLPQIRFDAESGTYYVGERWAQRSRSGEHIAHIDDLGPGSASSLRRSMQRAADGEDLVVCVADDEHFGYEFPPVSRVYFVVTGPDLLLRFDFDIDDYVEDEDVRMTAESLLGPLLKRTRCRLMEVAMNPYSASPPWLATASLAPSIRRRSVREVFEIGVEAEALLSAASSGQLTRTTTLDLLRAGHTTALIGQSEGHWLDVKRQDYDLSKGSDKGKISLAQDVARFANSEDGGVVAVGFATRKANGSEMITRVTPTPPLSNGTSRHAKAIDQRVFPPVEGLTVEEISVDGGVVVLVNVPPQPDELKPFLVQGAIVEGRVEGAFISIVRRRGEESIPITAQSIHSMLAAGRRILRRGPVGEE